MRDEAKTKKQLIRELEELRRHAADLSGGGSDGEGQEMFAKAFLENATPIFITTIKEGRLIDVSDAFLELTGLGKDEVIGNTTTGIGFITEDQRNIFLKKLEMEGRVANFELPIRVKGKGIRSGLINASRIRLGGEDYLLTVVMDITSQKRAEEALRGSEALYRTFINSTPDLVFLKDEQFRHIVVNQLLAQFFGRTEEEAVGRTDFELMPPAAAERCRETDLEALKRKSVVSSEEKVGDQVYETHKFPVPLGKGRTGVGGFIKNITPRKEAEDAFRESEALYRSLIETSPDPIIVHDLSGKILATNTQAVTVHGASNVESFFDEVRTIFDFLTENGRARMLVDLRTILAEGRSFKNEYEIRIRDGSTLVMEINTSIIRDVRGNDKAFISVLRDVTERKRSENMMICQRDLALALAKTDSLQDAMRLCIDASLRATGLDAGGIYIADPAEGAFRLSCAQGVSEKFAARIGQLRYGPGVEPKIMQGHPLYIRCNDIPIAQQREAVLSEGFRSAAVIPIRKQNETIGCMNVASRVHDQIPEHCRNILETIASQIGNAIVRSRSEDALRESESKFRDLAEKTLVGIYLIQDGLFRYVNAEFANIFGHSVENIVDRMGPKEVIFCEDWPMVEDSFQKRLSGELPFLRYEFRILNKNGEIRHVEVFSSRTFFGGKSAVIGTALDITDRRKAEEELRRLSTAIEQAAEDIIIADPEGVIQYVNPAFEKITGYTRTEAIGMNPRILKSGVHGEEFYARLWDTIKNGGIWSGRITNRRKDGKLIQEDATITPLLSSSGKLTGYVALKRDVTEAVKIED